MCWGLSQMRMVPPASPVPQYCGAPLPVLQQLRALCAESPSRLWVSSPISRHPGAGDIPKLVGSGCLDMGRIILLMPWLGQSQLQTVLWGLARCKDDGMCWGRGSKVVGSWQGE